MPAPGECGLDGFAVQRHLLAESKEPMNVLAINAGSSSLKFQVIATDLDRIRQNICAGMEWAGLTIDASQNQRTVGREGRIGTKESKLHAWVIPTNEELLIARDTVRCVLGEPRP
jgi:acetate kinase